MSRIASFLVASIAAMILAPISTMADIALSSNDGHTVLERGKQVAGKPPLPDSLSVIDLAQDRPRITATIEVPGSVVGPPMAVAVAPDESFAIVTSATKLDPAGVDGIGPDDRVSVIDLTSMPPRIAQSLQAGAGATVVRISPDGTLALVANRAEGTVSIFTIKDRQLVANGKADLDREDRDGAFGAIREREQACRPEICAPPSPRCRPAGFALFAAASM